MSHLCGRWLIRPFTFLTDCLRLRARSCIGQRFAAMWKHGDDRVTWAGWRWMINSRSTRPGFASWSATIAVLAMWMKKHPNHPSPCCRVIVGRVSAAIEGSFLNFKERQGQRIAGNFQFKNRNDGLLFGRRQINFYFVLLN